jgi:hypothetical protein
MRRLVLATAMTAAAAALAGCSITINTGEVASDAPPPASDSPAAPDPAPTETGMPAFATIDGDWCPADGPLGCITIALPDVLVEGNATQTVADPIASDDAAPCYASAIVDTATDMAEAAVFYCPAGVVPDAGVRAPQDNTQFDRLYFTQNPPDVDTWFRQEDLDAANG